MLGWLAGASKSTPASSGLYTASESTLLWLLHPAVAAAPWCGGYSLPCVQREEVGKLVRAAAQRAGNAVESTLKLTNWEVLLSYLLSGKEAGSSGKVMPVARRRRPDGAGGGCGGVGWGGVATPARAAVVHWPDDVPGAVLLERSSCIVLRAAPTCPACMHTWPHANGAAVCPGAGEEAANVRSLVREHTTWLETNSQRQLINYKTFVEQRAPALGLSLPALLAEAGASGGAAAVLSSADDLGGSGSSSERGAAGDMRQAEQQLLLGELESDAEARRRWRELRQAAAAAAADAADYSSWRRGGRRGGEEGEDDESALAATGALDPRRTEVLLEEEVREAVASTVGQAGGAAAFGVVLTWVLPSTLEDLMALGLASMVGYMSVLNLPMRRAEARRKLEALSASYAEVGGWWWAVGGGSSHSRGPGVQRVDRDVVDSRRRLVPRCARGGVRRWCKEVDQEEVGSSRLHAHVVWQLRPRCAQLCLILHSAQRPIHGPQV